MTHFPLPPEHPLSPPNGVCYVPSWECANRWAGLRAQNLANDEILCEMERRPHGGKAS